MVLNLISFTIGLRNGFQYQQAFNDYFTCEAFGSDPDNPCTLEVDRHRDHALTIFALTIQNFATYVALVYIIPVDKVKARWNKLFTNSKFTKSFTSKF